MTTQTICYQSFTSQSTNIGGYRYFFNGQEGDNEVFGELANFGYEFRQYDSRLGRWWSIDPKWNEYPSVSPFVFCNGSPIMLMDPNGEKVFAYNKESKRYMKSYLKEQFGSIRMFRFTVYDELKIRSRQYKKAMEHANPDQKILLKGMQDIINNTQKEVRVQIKENSTFFRFESFNEDGPYSDMLGINDGGTAPTKFGYYAVAINHKGANSISMTTDATRRLGKDDRVSATTGKNASAVFMHELLDESLNYFIEKNTSDTSPQKDKVYYQNAALRNKSLPERNGIDHE